jgi:hypothetical protein
MLSSFLAIWVAVSGLAHAVDALPVLDGSPLKTGQSSPEDAAVVVGIEDYLRVADVPGAVADAKLVRDFLVYTRGVTPGRVRMITSGASREVIMGALQDMAHQVGPSGTLWFYFAGHGGASPDGERLLLGDDVPTSPEALRARSITVSEIKKMGKSGKGQLMMVLDACYNGGTRQGGSVLEGGTRFVVPSAAIAQVKGVAEWNAAGPDQLARPLPGTGHGAFTYFWVGAGRGWADGQIDGKKDGVITAEESHEFIGQSLGAMGITTQTPQLTADSADAWKLVKGAKEPAPDLRGYATVVAPDPTPITTGGGDFASLAAEAARADAEAKAAADRAEGIKIALDTKRKKAIDTARSALLTKATKDWEAVSAILDGGGSATRAVVEKFVATYGEATVTVDDTMLVVPVPQVTEALAWLTAADREKKAASTPASTGGGGRVLASIPSGTTVRLDALSPEDAYYSSAADMVGQNCVVTADTNHNGEGWHGGPASCDKGSYYFYKAAFVPVATSAGVGPTVSVSGFGTGARSKDNLPAAMEVRIAEISPEDAYYPGPEMIGVICTTEEEMTHNGGGFYGGAVTCDDGGSYYFYKAALVPAEDSVATGKATAGAEDLGDKLLDGKTVTIVDIHPEDAYYSARGTYIGLTCTVSGDLHRNDGLWYGGGADCPGGGMYFYKAKFARASGSAPVATSKPSTSSGAAQDLGAKLAHGQTVTIVDIHPEDAYYAARSTYIGLSCTVSGDLHRNDGLWYGGGADCTGISGMYFYKAKFALASGGGTTTTSAAKKTGGAVPSGTSITLVDLSTEDAYYGDKASIIGKSCTAGDDLTDHGGGWYGGPVSCNDGSSFYFFKVGVSVGSSSASKGGTPYTSAIGAGTTVLVTDISKEDAYYSTRSEIIGKTCTAGGTTSYYPGGWHSGPFKCTDGSDYYFYQAALAAPGGGGGASSGTGGEDLGDNVADGVRVVIRDIRSGDLYYDNRDAFIGQSCTVTGDLHRNDGLYYGGGLTCAGQYWYWAYVSVSRR